MKAKKKTLRKTSTKVANKKVAKKGKKGARKTIRIAESARAELKNSKKENGMISSKAFSLNEYQDVRKMLGVKLTEFRLLMEAYRRKNLSSNHSDNKELLVLGTIKQLSKTNLFEPFEQNSKLQANKIDNLWWKLSDEGKSKMKVLESCFPVPKTEKAKNAMVLTIQEW